MSHKKFVLNGIAASLLCIATAADAAPFAAGVAYPLMTSDSDVRGGYPMRLRVVDDLNSDGRRDLVLVQQWQALQMLLSDNATPRAFRGRQEGVAGAAAMGSGDFNTDGKIDLVVGNATSFSLYTGKGDGSFNSPTTVDLDVIGPHANVEDLVVGNFDQDNKLDIAIIDADPLNNFRFVSGGSGGTQFYRNSVAVFYGRGDGTFDTTRPRIGTTAYPQRLAAIDFERDGKPELVAIGAESKTVQIASNNASNALGTQYGTVFLHVASEQADIMDVAAGFLDGGTKTDLAVLFYSSQAEDGRRYYLRPYLNTATTTPFAYSTTMPAITFDTAPAAFVLADVTGDGKLDAVVTQRRDDKPGVVIYPGTGAGGFGVPDSLPERFAAGDIIAADLDNDTKVDLAVIDRTHYKVVVYWHL